MSSLRALPPGTAASAELASQKPGNPSAWRIYPALQIAGSCGKVLGTAEIAPVSTVGAKAEDFFALRGQAQIRVDDGECALLLEQRKDARREDVNAAKGEGLDFTSIDLTSLDPRRGPDQARCDGLERFGPGQRAAARAAEPMLGVEEQVARGFAILDGDGGECAVFGVMAHHGAEIDGAENIDIVHQKRRVNCLG